MTHTIRILLIEDDRLVMGAIRNTLELEGWKVIGCEDGATALAEIEGEEHYDLIVTDYCIPGADGVELARAARALEHRRGTPIIMFTASSVDREAYSAGVDQFLRKPEDIYRITEIAHQLLHLNITR
jgi:CheY-like chemotaxis protein